MEKKSSKNRKKILVMGLPGAGKTYLSKILCNKLNAKWINADITRRKFNDWDFSKDGRRRQSKRMRELAENYNKQGFDVVADFVCPTNETRKNFGANFIVYMNTIKKSRFSDTNLMFQKPKKFDFEVKEKKAELYALLIADKIRKYKWNNKKPTAQMLGRWQPWHLGHQTLFEEIIKRTGQVNIMVRDVKGVGDNPFSFNKVKKNILKNLTKYKERVKVSLVPNITNICYGRGVGYKLEKINLDKKIQQISATKIRKKLRREGKL